MEQLSTTTEPPQKYQIYDWYTHDEPTKDTHDDDSSDSDRRYKNNSDNDEPKILQEYIAYMFCVTPTG